KSSIESSLHVFSSTHVAPHGQRTPAEFLDRVRRPVVAVFRNIGDHHTGPSRAKASAVARPMPFAAPVTNASLPVKDPFLFIVTFCSSFAGLSRPILVVTHFFHPVDDLAVERFLNGDVRHCYRCRRRGAMPMFLVRRE